MIQNYTYQYKHAGKNQWFFLFCLLLLTVVAKNGASQTNSRWVVKYNGLYKTNTEIFNNDTFSHYLRFYPGGKVISTTTSGTPNEIKTWFNFHMQNPDTGAVAIKGRKIKFSTSSSYGTVKYWGKIIDESTLRLKSKSLINGHRATEKYYFTLIPDL